MYALSTCFECPGGDSNCIKSSYNGTKCIEPYIVNMIKKLIPKEKRKNIAFVLEDDLTSKRSILVRKSERDHGKDLTLFRLEQEKLDDKLVLILDNRSRRNNIKLDYNNNDEVIEIPDKHKYGSLVGVKIPNLFHESFNDIFNESIIHEPDGI